MRSSLCEFHDLHIHAVLQKPHVVAVLFDLLVSFALPVSWNLPDRGLDIRYHTLGYRTRMTPKKGGYMAYAPALDVTTLFKVI